MQRKAYTLPKLQSPNVWLNDLGQHDEKSQQDKLQSVENKCFKLITGEEPVLSNFHKHKLLSIEDMIILMNLKHGHKCKNILYSSAWKY